MKISGTAEKKIRRISFFKYTGAFILGAVAFSKIPFNF